MNSVAGLILVNGKQSKNLAKIKTFQNQPLHSNGTKQYDITKSKST